MPVTEFAILNLRSGCDSLELLQTIVECQELQDGWVKREQPHTLHPGLNVSSMYTEDTDPPSLLITAPWDSPEAHGEWIQSHENVSANGKLAQFIAPGCGSVLLFHMEAAGKGAEMRKAFVHRDDSNGFNVCRLSVKSGEREALQRKYQALEEELSEMGLEGSVWAGWRIERLGDEEDLVLFSNDKVPRERLKELLSLSDKKDHRRFMHLV